MADFTKLNAAVETLKTDVAALVATSGNSGQTAVDAATANVESADQAVKDATTALTA